MGPLSALEAPDFDLATTLGSGQVFHWLPAEAGFVGMIEETPVYVEQREETLVVSAGAEERTRRYFALDHPLREIQASFPADDLALSTALAHGRGLRIIRQPLWECLATFITSSLKQVAHIAQISHALRRRFGRFAGQLAGIDLHAYPSPERLAAVEESELRACGLGYRAKTLRATARLLTDAGGASALERLRGVERAEALAALCEYAGVGTKVANCVLLFGYERLEAFPIDVWIERVLRQNYFPRRRKVTPRQLEVFCAKHFGPYGGYAQQYLFHHARTVQGRKPKPR